MKNLSRVLLHILKPNKRFFSTQNGNLRNALENFDTHMLRRRSEAQRSIVVQVPSVGCTEQVIRQCSAVGQVSSCFHYTTFNNNFNKKEEMVLVEFLDPGCVEEMMLKVPTSSSCFLPVRSPFFQYRADSRSLTQAPDRLVSPQPIPSPQFPAVIRDEVLSDEELKQNLFSCSSISEQMQLYYDQRKLSDLGYRLRFITCRQIEVLLSGLLPHMSVMPFGSSVNGFGHNRSDLDMVMRPEGSHFSDNPSPKWAEGLEQHTTEQDWGQQRVCSTRFLELVADLLKAGAPGCSKVVKILKARVPIVKYEQQLTGLDCDLSVNNWSGLYMSELLYQYAALDSRVGPLLFTLRLWAQEAKLTTSHPGRWITNFSLTTLALYYLVTLKLLPNFDLLRKHARAEDERVDERGMMCTYLRSLSILASLHQQPAATQDLSLEDLLYGFFCFYDKFDFRRHGLTITSGKTFNKPESSAMYIQNPLDGSLNVSRNVTLEEVERFCIAVTQACYTLREHAPQSNPHWGMLTLLDWSAQRSKRVTRINLKDIVAGTASEPPPAQSPISAPSLGKKSAVTNSTTAGVRQRLDASQLSRQTGRTSPTGDAVHRDSSPTPDGLPLKNSRRKNSANASSRKRKGEMLMRAPK